MAYRRPESCAGPAGRAPAVQVSAGLAGSGAAPVRFRLPVPPTWDDRPASGWATERRARNAYWAALDALATGRVDEEKAAKLGRLVPEVRSVTAQAALRHLLAVLQFVRRTGAAGPAVRAPARPWDRLVVTVPAAPPQRGAPPLARRYAWTLEWLRTRQYVAAKGAEIEWRVVAAAGAPVGPPAAAAPRAVVAAPAAAPAPGAAAA